MKKIFNIILSVIILLAGIMACTKIEDMSAKFNQEIAFNTSSPATKAIVEGTTMTDNFGVYGWVVPGTYSVNGGYLMRNAEYEETGDAANDAIYYWPKSDNNQNVEVIFTAYSQFDSSVTLNATEDSLTISIPNLTQALIDNPDDFDDVLWAQTKVDHHQDGNVGATHERVYLQFKHALSWLQFNADIKDNTPIKWVKVKQISFGEYRPAVAGDPGQEYIAPYNDTTDTWVNLKKSYSAVGSATKLKGPGESTYTNAAALPEELVNEIKSYYTVDNGAAGDYDLHMGNTVWASNVIKQLRRTDKAIPATYDIAVEMTGGEIMHFFNGWKYLQDNGYDIQPATSGGKPDVWNYVLIDAFVNGAAYTVVGLNCWDSNAKPQHTIVENPGQPYIAPTPGTPACASEGVYVAGSIVLPTKDTITVTPVATYTGAKDTTLNYLSAQVDTLFAGDQVVLGNALVIPQPVPTNITIVFDICIENNSGDEVIITDRKITRSINTGDDADGDATYTASWAASNKYIYNFRFNGDVISFNTSILDWTVSGNQYHVWDF